MTRTPVYSCLLMISLAASAGCQLMREVVGFEAMRPVVSLKGIVLKGISWQAVRFEAVLKIDNPNHFALDLARLRYRVAVDGKTFAQGRYDEKVVIPANNTITVKLPFSVQPKVAMQLAAATLQHQTPQTIAEWEASADFDTPLGAIELNFQDTSPVLSLR